MNTRQIISKGEIGESSAIGIALFIGFYLYGGGYPDPLIDLLLSFLGWISVTLMVISARNHSMKIRTILDYHDAGLLYPFIGMIGVAGILFYIFVIVTAH